MSGHLPQLHAVTDDTVLSLPDLIARTRAIAAAGPVAIHLRARAIPARQLTALAKRLGSTGAILFINDRADLARLLGAAGLHLPAAGLPVAAARRIAGPDLFVGRSAHAPSEARAAAAQGADYVFLGPVWPTASHPDRPALGVDAVVQAQPARVIAIGGITAERARQARAAGAYGVAAIRALWHADDPGSAARAMLLSLEP